jgi:hypothetical protein
MEVSSCCQAPVLVEFYTDSPHVTDDEYELKVPVWVCSICGAVIRSSLMEGKGGRKDAAAEGSGEKPQS